MQKREAANVLQTLRKLHSDLGTKKAGTDPAQLTLDTLYDGNRGKSKK